MKNTMSVHGLARSWWLMVVRGLVSVLLGLVAIFWPGLALTALVILLGSYLLVDGLLAISAGLSRHNGFRVWWLLLVEGGLSVIAGTWALLSPALTTLALLYLLAAWAIVTGLVTIVSAIRIRAEINNEGLLALSGVMSVALGVMLAVWPGASALVIVWLTGVYALAVGLLLIGLGFRLWNWQSAAHPALRPAWVGIGRHPQRPTEK